MANGYNSRISNVDRSAAAFMNVYHALLRSEVGESC